MKFILDQGIDYHLAEFLRRYEYDVDPITKHFPEDTDDSVWIPHMGRRGWVIITTDKRIGRRPGEREAYKRHKLRGFVVPLKGLNGFDIAERLIRHWRTIMAIAAEEEPPFFYRIPKGGARADFADTLQESRRKAR